MLLEHRSGCSSEMYSSGQQSEHSKQGVHLVVEQYDTKSARSEV